MVPPVPAETLDDDMATSRASLFAFSLSLIREYLATFVSACHFSSSRRLASGDSTAILAGPSGLVDGKRSMCAISHLLLVTTVFCNAS